MVFAARLLLLFFSLNRVSSFLAPCPRPSSFPSDSVAACEGSVRLCVMGLGRWSRCNLPHAISQAHRPREQEELNFYRPPLSSARLEGGTRTAASRQILRPFRKSAAKFSLASGICIEQLGMSYRSVPDGSHWLCLVTSVLESLLESAVSPNSSGR